MGMPRQPMTPQNNKGKGGSSLWDTYQKYFSPLSGGGLGSLFGGGDREDPMEDASRYLGEGYDPYINAGHDIDPRLHDEFMGLLNDPSGKLNNIGKGFHESPGFQFQLNQGLNAANNSASAGGLLGSAANQQSSQEVGQGLANEDYYKYLNNAMGLYSKGLGGAEGISKRGFDASTGKADRLSAMGFANAANKNASNSDFWSNLIGTGAKAAPYLLA